MATAPSAPNLPRRWYAPFAIVLFGVLFALAALIVPPSSSAAGSTALVGTLRLAPGSCTGGKITGTYLRMILPSGGTSGPYMSNSDSRCSDQSFTPLSPGTDGGIEVGSYQPTPSPAFDSSGNAKAQRITAPANFYGTNFATATNRVDPQTKTAVPAPSLRVSGSTLTADLRSFAVTWNNQNFNQGAPKPNGSTPGNTRIATGTYNASTGAFSLTWTSQVVGGPFDKFTGQWHLVGTFVPAARTSTGSTTGSTVTGTGSTGTTTTGTTSGTTGATTAPTAGGPVPAAKAGNAPAAVTGQPAAALPATTKVVTTQKWHVSGPVVGIAIGIALLALGALVLLSIAGRKAETA